MDASKAKKEAPCNKGAKRFAVMRQHLLYLNKHLYLVICILIPDSGLCQAFYANFAKGG
jgi:hypothetical protein